MNDKLEKSVKCGIPLIGINFFLSSFIWRWIYQCLIDIVRASCRGNPSASTRVWLHLSNRGALPKLIWKFWVHFQKYNKKNGSTLKIHTKIPTLHPKPNYLLGSAPLNKNPTFAATCVALTSYSQQKTHSRIKIKVLVIEMIWKLYGSVWKWIKFREKGFSTPSFLLISPGSGVLH